MSKKCKLRAFLHRVHLNIHSSTGDRQKAHIEIYRYILRDCKTETGGY